MIKAVSSFYADPFTTRTLPYGYAVRHRALYSPQGVLLAEFDEVLGDIVTRR